MNKRALLIISLAAMTLFANQVGAIQITAGYTQSDVGLSENGGGVLLAVGLDVLPDHGPVDLTVALEYVLRAGTQPRYFSNPVEGLLLDEAVVKLHYLQPAAFVGVTFPVAGLEPRLYTGFSLALKLTEDWNQPTGETNGNLSYEETDILGHVGLTLGFNQIFLDARYSFGFNNQLSDSSHPTNQPEKDIDLDFDAPEEGAKISGFQVGLGVEF